jgi:amino acid transporter
MGLRRNLGLMEVVGLSLSMIAPTTAMAFNVTLAAGAAGVAAPLAFAISTVVLVIVGLSFLVFARRISSAGSAYAYITAEFGPWVGFVAGWALLLTYTAFGSGIAALLGVFLDAALGNYHLALPKLWILHGVLAILLAAYLAYRDMQRATRLMLALEAISILAIILLGVIILEQVGRKSGLPLAPFMPDKTAGWSGVGFALVFAVLSFAGFEGAATLGEEAARPNLAIPVAVVGTVILAGLFFVFTAYAQVIGFGLGNMKALANAAAPLNDLALRYVSRDYATVLDLAATISAFSCVLASLSAAARMLFALSRAGLAPGLATVVPQYGTPGRAIITTGGFMLAGVLIWAPIVGGSNYYGDLGTIATLLLILVYMAVTAAAARYAIRQRDVIWAIFGALGAVFMLWPLYNSVYPVPAFPGNLWPYVVVIYLVMGVALLAFRPSLGHAPLAVVK